MSQALKYGQDFIIQAQALIVDLENLRVLQDRLADDSSLFNGYLADPTSRSTGNPGGDLTAFDLSAANDAITALMTVFNTAPNRARLFKLL